jgi:hypothetical protein
MTNRKRTSATIPTIPSGYKPARTESGTLPARLGVKRWLIRAARDGREVVVIDAVDEGEALQRAHSMSAALKTLGVWPALPVVYAEAHGDGPTTITWFREGLFLALNDLRQTAK